MVPVRRKRSSIAVSKRSKQARESAVVAGPVAGHGREPTACDTRPHARGAATSTVTTPSCPIAEIEAAAGASRRASSTGRRSCRRRRPAEWIRRATGAASPTIALYLKAEHLQKTGSFKARGMANRIADARAEARARGAITLSAGQRRPGVRLGGACRRRAGHGGDARGRGPHQGRGVPRATAHGSCSMAAHVGDTFAEMERIRDAEGLTFCHPFDDPTSSPAMARPGSSWSTTCPMSTSWSSGSAAAG